MEHNTEAKAAPAVPTSKKGGKRAKRTAKNATKPRNGPHAKRFGRRRLPCCNEPGGATLSELMKKFDWLPHTIR